MELVILNLSNITVAAPAYPHECLFVDFTTEQGKTLLSSNLFTDYEHGAKSLKEMLELHNFEKHDTPDFKNEAFFDCENGVKCCIGDDYIRFVDSETLSECESMYWTVDEIVEDFDDVMGAVVGCMCSGKDTEL